MDTNLNETTETNICSTLLDNRTLVSSHTVNTLSLIDLENHGNNNNHTDTIYDSNDNKNLYENHRHRQTVISTDFAQNSIPLNTTLPALPNINKPLPRLQRQRSVHFIT